MTDSHSDHRKPFLSNELVLFYQQWFQTELSIVYLELTLLLRNFLPLFLQFNLEKWQKCTNKITCPLPPQSLLLYVFVSRFALPLCLMRHFSVSILLTSVYSFGSEFFIKPWPMCCSLPVNGFGNLFQCK
jgi:hypothetical protein